jgi:phosphomannomutase
MAAAASVYPTLDQRPVKNTVVLFDVDDTLTLPRQVRPLKAATLL